MLFAHNFIGALLSVASEVAIGELIAIEALMDTTVRSFKDGEEEAREASNVDFIGSTARGRANRVVIGVFDVGTMNVPVVLMFVTDHGYHLGHGVVDTFHASVATGVIGARCELMYT